MRKLLTLSALLLFSVDVFADDEYCYVSDDNLSGLEGQIRRQCEKDEVVSATYKGPAGIFFVNQLAVLFCDFEQEIIINSDSTDTFLLCVLNDNEQRRDRR